MAVKLAFIHALASLHAGTGQGVGVIDLPIARERATGLPVVPGASIKGCLRDAYKGAHEAAIFGPERGAKSEHAGALHISDARLLLLPVRCLGATFVWATSPYVLRRLARDARAARITGTVLEVPSLSDGYAKVASKDPLITLHNSEQLVLEEMNFQTTVAETGWADRLAEYLFPGDTFWQADLRSRLAVIDDNSFNFLAEFATEVNAHIAIDPNTGTVDKGLWYQESLPAETVLVSILHTEKSRDGSGLSDVQIMKAVSEEKNFQLGGKATTGQGLVRFVPVEVAA